MGHRWDCPTEWEARRQGERSFERGDGSWRNPYRDDWHRPSCEEAEQAWNRGYRDAERQAEERAAEQRAQARREQYRREEAEYFRMQEEEAQQQAYYDEETRQAEERHWEEMQRLDEEYGPEVTA